MVRNYTEEWKMKFEDKFKPGDIICSDRFCGGKCMVVEELKVSTIFDAHKECCEVYTYRCEDLIQKDQWWRAYERDNIWGVEYDWRIATDDDIVNYLSIFVGHSHKCGEFEVRVTDNGFAIDCLGTTIYLDAGELAELGKLINKYVTTEAQEAKVKFNNESEGWFFD